VTSRQADDDGGLVSHGRNIPSEGPFADDVAVQEAMRTEINEGVEPAREGEFAPLNIGPLEVWPPVVLAPMAGVTNYPFRAICRRFGAGLYVSEMITARALVEGREKTLHLAGFGPDETPRSLQLYGVDPYSLGESARRLVAEGRVDHIDMNFGCPVRKVTSKGGGAAIPIKPNLLRSLVRSVVQNAGDVPVTIKFRIGIDDSLISYLDAGRIGQEEGFDIPVLGNGDIWECWDALRMMRQTGCAGVIVGRGCLGKPWLFRDLAAVFDGKQPPAAPTFGEIVPIILEHAERLSDWCGEKRAALMMRKQLSWYTKGFQGGGRVRSHLSEIRTVADVERELGAIAPDAVLPVTAFRLARGKSGGMQTVALPDGFLDDLGDDTPPVAAAGVIADGG